MKRTIYAPAKINLYLDVFPKRKDGYHDVKSVMQTVSLTDTVTAELSSGEIRLTCSEASLPCDGRNLAHRAAELFFQETGINSGTSIHIEKRIPVASGLAGGSTDAGAVLKLLNELCGEPLGRAELLALGAKLGADVPFCMAGGYALCTGVGDIVTPVSGKCNYTVLIARAGDGVATPWAYRKLDEHYGKGLSRDGGNIESVVSAVESGDAKALCGSVYNIFESVVLPHHREAAKQKKILEESGADAAMMSGSGPAVFGIFTDDGAADDAYRYLHSLGAKVFLCRDE